MGEVGFEGGGESEGAKGKGRVGEEKEMVGGVGGGGGWGK